ncbi:TIGR01777 family oxidoreductase [uncultured Pseudoteredinibacter sp.]|uniref:TIGR01777 family oxidoreductase n=1 Tax=uncultured Pseudoteredinibacter sp. TaxID=1641701 RepID=UPI0026164CB4|nr:TIGR01777 family oxidoreductase [uncultured Pseudoteredinibacter sp.]
MNILLTGASGFIAQFLIPRLLCKGHQLLAWSQSKNTCAQLYGKQVECFASLDDYWQLANSPKIDAVINLAGAGIADQCWSESRKAELLNSRISTTKNLIELISNLDCKPDVLLSASAIGFYGSHLEDEPLDESAAPQQGFTHDLCSSWEAEASQAEEYGIRVCLLRTGIVLGPGGALAKMRLPFSMGLGGRVGSGKQWMSWIHIEDEARAIEFLLENKNAKGAFNLTAPNAVQNVEFTRLYAESLRRPAIFPLPEIIPKLMLGEGAELLLEGQRIYPRKLLEMGFQFRYEELAKAFSTL